MDTVVATKQSEQKQQDTLPPPKPRETIGASDPKNVPLEIYNQEHSNSYLYELLDVDQTLPDEFKNQLSVVDGYLAKYIDREGLNPTTEGYKEAFKQFSKSLGIKDQTALEIAVERMARYIDAEQTLKAIKVIGEDKLLNLIRKSKTGDIASIVHKELERKAVKW